MRSLEDASPMKNEGASVSSTPITRRRSQEHEEVGAPTVWIAPDWASHPVIENYYGRARCARASSFYEVMCSPVSATATTTLGERCCGHDKDEDEGRSSSTDVGQTRRPFGSFSYSCTTDTSDEAGLGLDAEIPLDDHYTELKTNNDQCSMGSGSGFAQWSRMRRTMSHQGGGLVPVLIDRHFACDRPSVYPLLDASHGTEDLRGSIASSSDRESLDRSSPTSSRLRAKLQDSLRDIDDRIAKEYNRLCQARQVGKQLKVKNTAAPANVMRTLLCGVNTTGASHADGLAFLTEKVGMAVSHRSLNQLQRHRRHMRGLFQIVTAHNPDLELTERQLDSFESADAMLANDIKYMVLLQQYKFLMTTEAQRRRALVEMKFRNGTDCFEKPQVKSAMLLKLLEAVSWCRLVQRNAREETALSTVGKVTASETTPSFPSSESGTSLHEVQVEKMMNVLAGEAFYSVFNGLICREDWWEIAQAHFENLIFSSKSSRICQWIRKLSKDVAAVSYEPLEENDNRPVRSRKNVLEGKSAHQKHRIQQQAAWTEDPSPEQIFDFVDRLTIRVRREFNVPADVSKSLNVFIQRTVFPRIAVLCYNQKAIRDCQRKDKLWRKRCVELSGLPMENIGVPSDLVAKIRLNLPSHRLGGCSAHGEVFFIRAIKAFNRMTSVVPCDLLDELMHGVVILHQEAALVLGTTQFSVETFFPLLAYVLIHCRLPTIHAQMHLLENFAITANNANGEESYYVYCVHGAVEYICNTAELGTVTDAAPACAMSAISGTFSTRASITSVMPTLNTSSPKIRTALLVGYEPEDEAEAIDGHPPDFCNVAQPKVAD
ncbi:hypothetical protein PsorP6_006205 [Peronosclerospora sorghi]|uniref:Uncharacterized protein n=1 Tax=Peronosclerospora sorghi TaxID=230839 RepID=A0ACC0W5I1_9STRA|nr:hypothetical protein PsorP6_006205 [Peronosclerospora sorghi]